MAFIKRDLFNQPEEESKPIVYSVTELCNLIRKMFDENKILNQISIEGEISNLTFHSSGHIYFTLKDNITNSTINAFFPKDNYPNHAKPQLKEGMKIGCKGKVSIFSPSSRYQITIMEVWQKGVGDLMQQFLMLKERLNEEGLFDPKTKFKIPIFPKRIVLLTSPTGAVLHDISQTLENRKAKVEVLVIPCVMQGEKCAESVIHGIEKAHKISNVDFILIARGGGSFEDLMPFNDENLARTVFRSKIPIVSAIGHETDVTILDYVADLRASTPTQAAQIVPESKVLFADLDENLQKLNHRIVEFLRFQQQNVDYTETQLNHLLQNKFQTENNQLKVLELNISNLIQKPILEQKNNLNQLETNLKNNLIQSVKNAYQEINSLENDLNLMSNQLIKSEDERLENIENQLHNLMLLSLKNSHNEILQFEKELSHLNPEKILERGYSLTLKDGKIITSAHELEAGDQVENVFKDGRKKSEILD